MKELNFDILINEELMKSLATKKLKRTKFLFSIIGFGLGSVISLLSILAEDLSHEAPIFSDIFQLNHLTTPLLLGILGAIFGSIIDRRAKKLNKIYFALYESQQSLSIITDNLPVLISFVDSDMKYRFTNKMYEHRYNLTSKEIYGRSVKEIVGEEYFKMVEGHMMKAFSGEVATFESKRSYEDDKIRFLKSSFIPYFNSDRQVSGVFTLVTDVTELREREEIIKQQNLELTESNATKDKFLSIISHDLKNPFSGLLGYSDLLLSDFDQIRDEDKKLMIRTIRQISEQTYKLLQNLLDWSRLQTDTFQYAPSEFVLSECISEEFFLQQEIAKQKELTMFFVPENQVEVVADRNMVSTVIRNLISNAIKFTHSKGIIRIEITNDEHFATVRVTDTGVGISEANLQKLFKVTGNYKTYGTNHEEGTGLGLILCKEFIRKNGGEISVESKVGEGTRICFTVPLKKTQAS